MMKNSYGSNTNFICTKTSQDSEVSESDQAYRATVDDAQLVSEILGKAFEQDPVLRWVIDNPSHYQDFFAIHSKGLYLQRGLMYVHKSQQGAAMWMPPEVSLKESFSWLTIKVLLKLLLKEGFPPLRRLEQVERIFRDHRPQEPHYYLHAVGAITPGKGIGSALIKAGLRHADEQHLPAYLESSNEKNVPLYERHGFETIQETRLGSGPPVWFMYRNAR